MSQFFPPDGQSTGVSALASFLPKKSRLISFRMDWLDLLAVQGTLKSLFQHHNSKASILQCSAFFIFQLSHPYITTGKTIDCIVHGIANADPGLIPGLERSPGEGKGCPLQYFGLENPRDGGVWWAAVYRVTQSRT